MRVEEIQETLTVRLRDRWEEIEQATLTRIRSISSSSERPDSEYADGLPAVVSAALEYGIDAIERCEDHAQPIPTALLSQARLAARHGVALETVLRRYLAGYTLLGDFLIEESEREGSLNGDALKRLLRVLAAVLDRLIAAVSEEYAREAKARPASTAQRRVERVERLLAGEFVDTSELGYEFDAHHVAMIASGAGAIEAVDELLKNFDCRRLVVQREECTAWVWLGSRLEPDLAELEHHTSHGWPAEVSLAMGEPGRALAGWRLSHQQAKAALPVAQRGFKPSVRYADVALLASMLSDYLLVQSLRQIFLAPLGKERDGGATLRQTLRAYFQTGRNVSSAAAALEVSRRTVANRLRVVEDRLGRPLESIGAEMEVVLRLQEIEGSAGHTHGSHND